MSAFPLPEDETRVVGAVDRSLLIGGRWVEASNRARLTVSDPATAATLCSVPDATAGDANEALAQAADFQSEFASMPARERATILRRAYELMIAREDDLALLTTLEMGKTLREARAEVRYAADFLLWFSEEAPRVGGAYRHSPAGDARIVTHAQPVGTSLLVTPWNFPLAMATRKIGPAVAAGCTTIVKPASETPLGALALGRIMLDAGLPPRALSIVITSDPTSVFVPLLADPRARKLSFTGSTEVGRRLLAAAAPNVMRTSMELGGNAPFLVFADADLDTAVAGALVAKLRNGGQSCTAANRFLVERSVAVKFADLLATAMREVRVGRGTEPDVDLGPLINDGAAHRLRQAVGEAIASGATPVAGEAPTDGEGSYFTPTVLADVEPQSLLARKELFGPVAPIVAFSDEDEAVRIANSTEHGLVAFAYTDSVDRALRVADRLEAGMVGINRGVVSNAAAPFGGIKHSGLGREGGTEGILEYLETKYVSLPGM